MDEISELANRQWENLQAELGAAWDGVPQNIKDVTFRANRRIAAAQVRKLAGLPVDEEALKTYMLTLKNVKVGGEVLLMEALGRAAEKAAVDGLSLIGKTLSGLFGGALKGLIPS